MGWIWGGAGRGRSERLGDLRKKRQTANQSFEAMREQIRDLEARLRQKQIEHAREKSRSHRVILVHQINDLMQELEFTLERAGFVDRFVGQIRAVIHKAETIRVAREQNLDEATIDRIAIEADGVFDDLRDTDIAIAELERATYTPSAGIVDFDRAALVSAVERAVADPAATGADNGALPATTRERLRALGVEVDD